MLNLIIEFDADWFKISTPTPLMQEIFDMRIKLFILANICNLLHFYDLFRVYLTKSLQSFRLSDSLFRDSIFQKKKFFIAKSTKIYSG